MRVCVCVCQVRIILRNRKRYKKSSVYLKISQTFAFYYVAKSIKVNIARNKKNCSPKKFHIKK